MIRILYRREIARRASGAARSRSGRAAIGGVWCVRLIDRYMGGLGDNVYVIDSYFIERCATPVARPAPRDRDRERRRARSRYNTQIHGCFGSRVCAIVSYFIYGTHRRAATRAPGTPRRRARDVAIDCDCDDREIAADDGRRCARGEARRGDRRDATEARVTSRGFDVARAGATRTTDANG